MSDPAGNLWLTEAQLDINSKAVQSAIAALQRDKRRIDRVEIAHRVRAAADQPDDRSGRKPLVQRDRARAACGWGGAASSQLGMVDPADPTAFEVTVPKPAGGAVPVPFRISAWGRRYNLVH